MRSRDVRWIRVLGYSAVILAALGGILILASGQIGVGIIVLVFTVLLGLALARVERLMKNSRA